MQGNNYQDPHFGQLNQTYRKKYYGTGGGLPTVTSFNHFKTTKHSKGDLSRQSNTSTCLQEFHKTKTAWKEKDREDMLDSDWTDRLERRQILGGSQL